MTVNWRQLVITDSDGELWNDDLGALVADAPANLDNATIRDGRIESWLGFFISAPDEEPDWNTPMVPVDWSGFAEALASARGEAEAAR